jgi:hypothetical protein
MNEEAERQYLAELRKTLETRFDEGELRSLCADLGVDYAALPATGKANKSRELISYLYRRDRIADLVKVGKDLRPDIPWDEAREPLPPGVIVPSGPSNRVLFDEAHGQGKWFGCQPTVGRGYRRIADVISRDYIVERLTEGEEISLSRLQGYAALVLPIGPMGICRLSDEELRATVEYVDQGHGGLMVLGTYTGDWHHQANLNNLIASYGISLNTDHVLHQGAIPGDCWRLCHSCDVGDGLVVTVQPGGDGGHRDNADTRTELLRNVRRVVTLSSCSLYAENRDTVLDSGPESVVFKPVPIGGGTAIQGWIEEGPGPATLIAASRTSRVVVVGGWKTFLTEFVDEPECDNLRLFQNILGWISAERRGTNVA